MLILGGGYMKTFASYIKKLRVGAGLTQEEVAESLQVSKVTVQNWEKGKGIRRDRLKELSTLFSVPIGDLKDAMDADINDEGTDNWPDFLFEYQREDDEGNIRKEASNSNNHIVSTLHLNLEQQELFGILSIYGAEYLQKDNVDIYDREDFEKCLKIVPFDYINKVGSIQFMNIYDGLYKVLRYVKPDFLLKILKMDPDWQFNLKKLSKDLICEFIECGHKSFDTELEWEESEETPYFSISMHKARVILPLLEQENFYFNDDSCGACLRDDTPEKTVQILLKICGAIHVGWIEELHEKKELIAGMVNNGLEIVTEWHREELDDGKKEYYLSINETGRKLLKWFDGKE